MTNETLWNTQEPVTDWLEVPAWIDQDITPVDVAAILQGGCASGAYMPAVTYAQALETMSEHGEAIFDVLEDGGLEPVDLITNEGGGSWSQMATTLVSSAVELWASQIADQLTDAIKAGDEEE